MTNTGFSKVGGGRRMGGRGCRLNIMWPYGQFMIEMSDLNLDLFFFES